MSAEPFRAPGTTGTSTSPYTAGRYPVPIRFLYGTAAEINFWDVVYFQAYTNGGSFETSTQELVEQTGLTRQVISKLRQEATAHGELVEDVSFESGRRFHVQVARLDQLKKGVIWKPLGYVANGWQHAVTPAIPKRVLNLYLQQPHQRLYRLDPGYIAAKCQRRFPYEPHQPIGPLNTADVSHALRLLIQLGLLVPEGDGVRLVWSAFDQPAPGAPPRFAAPDPHEHQLFTTAYAVDPVRAERALEVVIVGAYDLEAHFADIFRDLAYIHHEDDYCLLRHKAYTRRSRLPGPQRWQETWRVFRTDLKRRASEIRFPKVVLNLEDATHSAITLPHDLNRVTRPISAVVTIVRLEWPWYLRELPPIQVEVLAHDHILFTRTLNLGDGEMRFTLRPDQWTATRPPVLTLHARCAHPLPGVQVEAWVEAKLQR